MANLPASEIGSGGAATSEDTEEVITNYQPTTTDTETITQPGEVMQYIVSAIVEGDYSTSKDADGNVVTDADGAAVREYVGLQDDRVKVYEDYLRAAVGEGKTPTQITVNDHPFEIEGLAAARVAVSEIEAARTREMVVQYLGDAAKILLILFGFLLARRFLRRVTMVEVEEGEVEAAELPHASPEDRRRQEVAEEIERLSVQQPEAVAALLRSWIAEDNNN